MLSTVIVTIFLVMSFCSSLIILAVCVGAARSSRIEEMQEGILVDELMSEQSSSDWYPQSGEFGRQNA